MTTPVFDLGGPLPSGPTTTVLQASAGTGKTHTIAALATRYVAEGVTTLDRLMLVTFGRAATVELRERVREHLTEAAAIREPGVERDRLERALADFDAATISTTHGFCSTMLDGLGLSADVDADATFLDAATELVDEVATDLYVQAFGRAGSEPAAFGFDTAASVARLAVGDRSARLEPLSAPSGSVAARRRRLGEVVRAEVDRRKLRGRIRDYDDLLRLLRDALLDPRTGEDARERIRSRYDIVMVDEFQDTDPVQWEILEATFHGRRTLVLIGDPKQAIYAFRGADVVTYLLATETAGGHATLGTNWRSDAPLLRALSPVLEGVALGDARIVVGPVAAAHPAGRLSREDHGAPLRLRVVDHALVPPAGGRTHATVGQLRPFIARDLARDIADLLGSGATLVRSDPTADPRVQPGDIAVLVQRNPDGVTVRDALQEVGVPVVLTGTASVFSSSAAHDWLTFLSALDQPQRPGLGRAAALTPFVGWSAARLDGASEAEVDALNARLRGFAEIHSRRGVAALLEAVGAATAWDDGLVGRVLGRSGGERYLTDLRHIGQALHVAAVRDELGAASQVRWLQERIDEAAQDVDEERSRRLETDAEAVQVITVHRSKGLEFPVVYLPYLWSRHVPSEPETLLLHDGTQRVRDIGGPTGTGYAARLAQHQREDADESLRLAYVALTRARSQVVAWWAPSATTGTSPLHRLLFGDRDESGVLPLTVRVPPDERAREALDRLAAREPGCIAVEPAEPGAPRPWQGSATVAGALNARRFDRSLDLTWTRTSYSGLTAGLHGAAGGAPRAAATSEAEDPGTLDEPEVGAPESVPSGVVPSGVLVSPMAELPVGASFGTLVHSVLEDLDFTAPDLRSALVDRCAAVGSERLAGVPPEVLADALLPSLRTPLGPLAGGLRLADLPLADVLSEMQYEYPLGGAAVAGTTVAGIGALLRSHLPADDPMHAYADDLAVEGLGELTLRGFLGGFIDAVLRVRDADGCPRYVVVDYKTNRLGADPVTSWDYRPEAVTTAMREAHYPLQALLYAVALHRFLRWRQPGYDPDVHLGGILYLFLRGMCGPDTPTVDGVPAGVFSWRPPGALVVALSDLLDGGER